MVAKSRLGLSPDSVTSELCVLWQTFVFTRLFSFFFFFLEQFLVHS